jgi:hypothetical protein
MIGSLLKYTAAAFVGAVVFASAMHYTDDTAYDTIKAAVDAHETLLRAGGKEGDELKEAMADFIKANRVIWDKTYILKETSERVNTLYANWI